MNGAMHSSMAFLRLDPPIPPPRPPPSPPYNHRRRAPTTVNFLYTPPTSHSISTALDSCSSSITARSLHAHVIKLGFHLDEFVETKLVQIYGRFGCSNDAYLVFDEMPQRNLYSWVAMMNVCVDYGLFMKAFRLFEELMCDENDVKLEFFLYPVVLKICGGLEDIELGRQIHGVVVKIGFVSNVYVGNALIDMYGKCGGINDAKKVLDVMPKRDVVSWNSMISGLASNGMVFEALEVFDEMVNSEGLIPNVVSWSAVIGGFSQYGYANEAIELLCRMRKARSEPNARTLASVLPAFARLESLDLGKEIHGYITRRGYMENAIVVNGLLDVYRRCGDMGSAHKVFSIFSVKNLVSFNTMIVGYCETGNVSKAEDLFSEMELKGMLKDVITWNAMISGYVDNLMFDKALSLFRKMQMVEGIEEDSYTLGSVLSACSALGSLRLGKEVHSRAIVKGLNCNPFVGEAIIEMYCEFLDPNAAEQVFEEVIDRDIATWNALISGLACCCRMEKLENLVTRMKKDGFDPNVYTWNGIILGHIKNGLYETALELFVKMQTTSKRPDIYTVGTILPACSRLATIERGKQVHAYSIRCAYDSDVHIGASLIDMYAKCGSINDAIWVNARIPKPNLVSKNAMLMAYAMNGYGNEGISLFQKMLEYGFTPDESTFVSVLSCCIHTGEVELGRKFFDLMGKYDVKSSLKHYTCMVDLLSRSGKTRQAYELVKGMPIEPDSVTWGALLGGCVVNGDIEIGEVAAERLIELESDNVGNFVLLGNLYANGGRWSDLARIRRMMRERRMNKNPGCSWIEDANDVHVFTASDTSHRRTDEIYATLENLVVHMKSVTVIEALV